MATKVSVFGQQPTETKELKKIEFVKRLNLSKGGYLENNQKLYPSSFDNVQLFGSGPFDNMDIILAWDDNGEMDERNVFIGHWNDGIV